MRSATTRALATLLLGVIAVGSAFASERASPTGEVEDVGVPAVGRGNRVFVPVTTGTTTDDEHFQVVAVSAIDGRLLWQRIVDARNGYTGAAYAAVTDRHGDVVVVGSTGDHDGGFFHRLTVVKLDGETGDVIWQPDLGIGIAEHVALDRHGDVVALARGSSGGRLLKLDGVNGATVWEVHGDDVFSFWPTLLVDRRGNVTVGSLDGVRRFAARDGSLRWWAGGPTVRGVVSSAMDGVTVYEEGNPSQIVRRDRRGREVWRRPAPAATQLVRADERGNVVAVSFRSTSGGARRYPFTVTRIDRWTGATLWTHESVGGYALPVADVLFDRLGDLALFGWSDGRGCVRSIDTVTGRALWDRRAMIDINPRRMIANGAQLLAVSDAGVGVDVTDVATLPDASTKGIGLCGMD